MRVVFLDIDGVLNSFRSCIALRGYGHLNTERRGKMTLEDAKLDPIALKLVQKLVKETDAKVVISSSWRILAKEISDFDFLDLPVIAFTENLAGTRGQEIQRWLDENEVSSYTILDDDNDMLQTQMDSFVKCKADYGFSMDEFEQAYQILTGEKYVYGRHK